MCRAIIVLRHADAHLRKYMEILHLKNEKRKQDNQRVWSALMIKISLMRIIKKQGPSYPIRMHRRLTRSFLYQFHVVRVMAKERMTKTIYNFLYDYSKLYQLQIKLRLMYKRAANL